MSLILPAYSPSTDAPSYSRQPLTAERTLEYCPRIGYRQPVDIPTGVFERKTKLVSLMLFNQSENGTIPVYGPHLPGISGELSFVSPERVLSVALKLRGRMVVMPRASPASTTAMHILDTTELLYNRYAIRYPCPNKLAFTVLIPRTHMNGDRSTWYLPPTFLTPADAKPGTWVQIDYSMIFEITICSRAHILHQTKLIYIPFRYEIRDRPQYPYLLTPSPISTLKTTPEEWQIKNFIVGVHEGHAKGLEVSPIECQMIIPSTSVFSLVDSIPFHIELFGAVKSLCHFFSDPKNPQDSGMPIRVSLVRQVLVTIGGQNITKYITLGEANIRSLPPPASIGRILDDRETLDWEGELKVDPGMKDVRTGGFRFGVVCIEDFIVLNLIPRFPETSLFRQCVQMYRIRLVTDSWCPDLD